jgi:phthalate 4,5-dioxygenase
MLGRGDNEALCGVEPGTIMHNAFKRYWVPAGLSSDLVGPDCDPMRTTMLSEDYVMFRDSAGKVALMRERCCHRGASLMLGRVEDGGIRCIYHGWKFAANGAILDMPNCQDEKFKTRYRQPAYPVREVGGIIWTYLGPAELEPPFPDLPFADLPADYLCLDVPVFKANYMQVMEGGLDSSHLGVLHADVLGTAARGDTSAQVVEGAANLLLNAKAPRVDMEETDFGLRYAAIREEVGINGAIRSIARVTAFALPACCFIPPDNIMLFALPVTSELTHFYHIHWKYDGAWTQQELQERRSSRGLDDRGMQWFGLGRAFYNKPGTASRENNFLQDRKRMRAGETFSGLVNFIPEDAAVTSSAGDIYDRTEENLVPADAALARVRRVILDNARGIEEGREPIGLDPKTAPRPAMGEIDDTSRWQDIPYRQGAGAGRAMA